MVHSKHVKCAVELELAGNSHQVAGMPLFPSVKFLEHWGHLGLLSVVLQAARLNAGQIVCELFPYHFL